MFSGKQEGTKRQVYHVIIFSFPYLQVAILKLLLLYAFHLKYIIISFSSSISNRVIFDYKHM